MSAAEDVYGGKAKSLASLDSIPNELFLMICDYIDADTLVRSMIYVNKHFYSIISNGYLWKKRVARTFNDCSVAFMKTEAYNENTFDWRQFAWSTEVEYNCWSKYETNTTSTTLKGAHFAEVDAVILTHDGNRCITASRDRSICMWDTTNTVTNPVVHKTNSHIGWIWELQMFNEQSFLSCSWDSKIKLWSVENFSQDANPLQTFIADSAVLSIASKENFVAAGVYTRKILAYDPRESGKRLFEIIPHTRSIIELCLIKDYYLVSLSEDKTLAVWDLRTQSPVTSINLAEHGSRLPLCATYYDNVLFVSDSVDYVYWLDCSHGLFNMLEAVDFVQLTEKGTVRNKINCIKCTNYGSVITGGSEGCLYITTATNPPKAITKINVSGSEIASIDYQSNTLAVGYVNSEVQIWKKK